MAKQSYMAEGDIRPSRFVKLGSADGKVLEADAGERIIGISQAGTNKSPYTDSSGLAAVAGDPIMVYGDGEECLLEFGGTIAHAARIKSDADGKGVTAATDKDQYGAIAKAAGVSGELIMVQVQVGGEVSV